jgi:tungstate transport system substrate-binding protein
MRPLAAALALLFLLPLAGCIVPDENSSETLRLATTTSMRDSGLLDVLTEEFERQHGIGVEYVAVGTGAALQLGRTGDVDALIVHAPDQEQLFIDDGFAHDRTPIAYNAFVLLSPLHFNGSVYDAFERIANEEQCFVSRGDESGTHAKEQAIWRHLNETRNLSVLEDSNGFHPPGDWYFSIGQGMGAAINMAHEKDCTTLSDRGTALRFQNNVDLERYEFDDEVVQNPYAYLIVQPNNTTAAHRFGSFLVEEGRLIIASYTINGDHAFFVDS